MATDTLPLLTVNQVIDEFGFYEVEKAQSYIQKIKSLVVMDHIVSAQVKGSSKTPYRIMVHVNAYAKADVEMVSYCSCPVHYQCKHGAATMLAYINQQVEPSPAIRERVHDWLRGFREAVGKHQKEGVIQKATERLFYCLDEDGHCITLYKGRPDTHGLPQIMDRWSGIDRAISKPPKFVCKDDLSVIRLLYASLPSEPGTFSLQQSTGDDMLKQMAATGRLISRQKCGYVPLAVGMPRAATLHWTLDGHGKIIPAVVIDNGQLLLAATPWYLDLAAKLIGPLQFEFDAALLGYLLMLPPITKQEAAVVAQTLTELAPDLPVPTSNATAIRTIDCSPTPVLVLESYPVAAIYRHRNYQQVYTSAGRSLHYFDAAQVEMEYAGHRLKPEDDQTYWSQPDGTVVCLKRNASKERQWIKTLSEVGLATVPPYAIASPSLPHDYPLYGLDKEADWPVFMLECVPLLKEQGWLIEFSTDFRHHASTITDWYATLQERDAGWFDVAMQIEIDGQRIDLPPLLTELMRHDKRWLDLNQQKLIPDDEVVTLVLPDGGRATAPAGRIKPLMRTLIDLFDSGHAAGLAVSRLDAPRVAEALAGWSGDGVEMAATLAKRLIMTKPRKAMRPPKGLGLALRPYQLEGLNWLQFLREQALAGILADDMGLGKTAQTLAHLLLEKEAGRLDQPALIVLPTSLVHNWKSEARRFTPGLRVLSLQGMARKQAFEQISMHDVVLTTYPLLWRDIDTLSQYHYHLLVLDEAQSVKNAGSKTAEAVRQITARHRLCITGTPLENHLGELWALFDFLMPRFLGDSKTFTKLWRTPIEKQGDSERRKLLARRIKPFILRRSKDQVAKELPPKTVIVRKVVLEGKQRDLYETVRTAMDGRIREEIASKGLARSQIVILDALLKLRQVCCDPRLVKIDSSKQVTERAKLALLMQILPELIDEGRKVLLFSQFTSMLGLIETELKAAKLDYVVLQGDTHDRETPIRRFQSGEVPIFLISLKAGGVGLNLTAADTVIHFDPWWNPAVENQATDRAHRIGQDKPVFVYKLIVEGSIEDKILALQDKKAELAAGILSEDHGGSVKFTEEDIAALLAPLPT
ncbi:superfamily II DNA or RNA helicase [Chitinivorax tropicus]|uniref:Superfamily II DNA or RNA helicase n=1 Tax=Chitinivorax tropicus TaxID=714531 RepID=A0A840MLT5_9PROT|nr:DEAD/DEAH box helicase [Chitinivorax tropicus]MBB5019370.1 superfamily II DNA or RNA helicase [Chitinivorax tropicus]